MSHPRPTTPAPTPTHSLFDIIQLDFLSHCFLYSVSLLTTEQANPVATLWTASEMLRWLGEKEAAALLLESVEAVCEKGVATPDLGGQQTTAEVTSAVCEEIEGRLGR